MADVNGNLPNMAELSSMYGSWNPMAYATGMANQDIAAQFRNQDYQQQQNNTLEGLLKNQQSEQMNPLLLERQRGVNKAEDLLNEGRGYDNTTKRLQSERDVADQGNRLSADQRKAAISASDDDIKLYDNHVGQLLRSADPKERQQGLIMQGYLPSILAERRKNEQEMALQSEQTRSHLAGIGMGNASAQQIEQMRIDAGKYNRKSFAMTINDRIMRARTPVEKAEALEDAYATASLSGDQEAAAVYKQRAMEARQRAAEDAANRGAANPRADLGALGVTPTAPPAANAPIAGNKGLGTADNPIVLK